MTVLKGNRRDLNYADRDLEALAFAVARVKVSQACVQAGANVGVFPLMLSRVFAEVYTFEPDPDTYRILLANLGGEDLPASEVLGRPEPVWRFDSLVRRTRARGRGNVHAYRAALGAIEGRAELVKARRDGTLAGHTGVHHINMKVGGQVTVMLVDQLQLGERCGLIYLDVEGFEREALAGAKKTIRAGRPVIGVEINKALEARGIRAEELCEDIVRMDYKPVGSVLSDRIFVPREWGQ